MSYHLGVRRKNLIGNRIREARETAKPPLTQLDLVARLELQELRMDQSTLSKIENQQRPVTDVELIGFSRALKVSAAWLLGEDNSSKDSSTKTSKSTT
ncbi:XRE family transcriptional regulator [Dehalogenimonas etheniformans]|uniref:XRE family transcriptional regulator n=1 Tax=Dehalogenimonas etheniformans TaxID=1536648 RepID=A0A2P5P8P8_9CHLR|nr:XRE family transcriptional regulator [Dehalogenimonas etheniformans]